MARPFRQRKRRLAVPHRMGGHGRRDQRRMTGERIAERAAANQHFSPKGQ